MLHQAPITYGVPRSRWRLADLPTVLPWLAGYTVSGLSKAVRRVGLSWQRGRLRLHSPDPAYQVKLARVARAHALAQRFPTRVGLLYADEVSLYRQPTLAQRWSAVGVSPSAPLSLRSNRYYRFSGALDALSGQVVFTDAPAMRVPCLCDFLRAVRAANPDRHLFLVWDNWPVHKHARVLATAHDEHIHLLWLPTYAPWTNPIEKLWRTAKQTVVHHHQLADDPHQVQQQFRAFLTQFAQGSPALLRTVGLLPD